jgi:hypothetical protein
VFLARLLQCRHVMLQVESKMCEAVAREATQLRRAIGTTRSAASAMGRLRYGVANVLSMRSGMPVAWVISATRGISSTSRPGLPMVSAINSRVLSPIAARKPSRSWGLTKVPYQLKHPFCGRCSNPRCFADPNGSRAWRRHQPGSRAPACRPCLTSYAAGPRRCGSPEAPYRGRAVAGSEPAIDRRSPPLSG